MPWATAPAAGQAPWGAPTAQPPQPAWGSPATPGTPQPSYGANYGGGYPGGSYTGGGHAGGPAEPRKSSKVPVIIALVVLVALIVGVAIWVFGKSNGTPGNGSTSSTSQTSPTTAPTSTSTGGKTAIRVTQVGDCFELSTTANYTTPYAYAWVMPCTQPHDSEVVLNQSMTADSYPDDSQWDDWFHQYCYPAFESYVGSTIESTELDMQYIFPEPGGWDAGDHHMVCFVVDPMGDRTSSVKDSGE